MIKKTLGLLLCTAVLIFGCQKPVTPLPVEKQEEEVTPPSDSGMVTPSDSSDVVPVISAVEDKVIDFKSGYRGLNVTVSDAGDNILEASWTGVVCDVRCSSRGGGNFLVKYNVRKNEGKTDLEGTVTLSCGDAVPVTFKVLQKCDEMIFHVPGVIAHRGFHNAERPENSIAALKAAQELGIYGVELDVWFSTDSVLFVNHDGWIGGYSVPQSDSKTLSEVRLDNGEPLPTLEDFLNEAKKVPSVKLVIEIKSNLGVEHVLTTSRLAIDKVREMGMENQCDYIAFSYDACKYIKSQCPGNSVALLEKGNRTIAEMAEDGIDVDFGSWELTRDIRDEAKKYGLSVNIWTVNDGFAGRRTICDFITTDRPDEAKAVYDDYLRTL